MYPLGLSFGVIPDYDFSSRFMPYLEAFNHLSFYMFLDYFIIRKAKLFPSSRIISVFNFSVSCTIQTFLCLSTQGNLVQSQGSERREVLYRFCRLLFVMLSKIFSRYIFSRHPHISGLIFLLASHPRNSRSFSAVFLFYIKTLVYIRF